MKHKKPLNEMINLPEYYAGKFSQLLQKEKTQQMLDEKMDRWMYLEDLKAKIDSQ